MTTKKSPQRTTQQTGYPRTHKLVVYFRDGNVGRFYSNDFRGKERRYNPERGLLGLRKLVLKYKGFYDCCLIYRCADDVLLEKYDAHAQLIKPIENETDHPN